MYKRYYIRVYVCMWLFIVCFWHVCVLCSFGGSVIMFDTLLNKEGPYYGIISQYAMGG